MQEVSDPAGSCFFAQLGHQVDFKMFPCKKTKPKKRGAQKIKNKVRCGEHLSRLRQEDRESKAILDDVKSRQPRNTVSETNQNQTNKRKPTNENEWENLDSPSLADLPMALSVSRPPRDK